MAASKPNPATPPAAPATTPAEPERPKLKPAEEKALFVAADKAEKEEDEAEAMLSTASEQKSLAIKAIFDALGKGPFMWKGRRLYVSSREGTYFFKGDTKDARQIG